MASILAQIQAQGGARPRVQVYSPVSRQRQAAPTRRTNAPRGRVAPSQQRRQRGEVDWAAIKQAFDSTNAAQEQRQEEEQRAAQGAEWDKKPWYEQGLGMVLGNPVAENLLKPLGVLGTLGRGVAWGAAEVAERLPMGVKMGLGNNSPAGALKYIDVDRSKENTGSFAEEVLNPSSSFGWGEILRPSGNEFWDNATGFIGDVAFDPLTYTAGGGVGRAGRLVPGIDRAANARRAADALDESLAAMRDLGRARPAEISKASQAARAARETADALEGVAPNAFEVPLRGGRNARAQMIGEAAIRDPETYARLSDELVKGGRRGFGQMSKEAQELLNVTPSAARVLGTPIAGTERYARKMAQLSGLGREAFVAAERALPGGSVFSRGTKGLEKALGTLTRGTGELDPLVAGTTVAVANAARIPEGTVRSLGNQSLRQLRRDIKGTGEDGIRAMVREAEVPGQSNRINEFFADIRRIYEETSGNKLNEEYLRDPTGYMPHKLTPEFKRMLKAHSKNQTVAEFMKREGFYQDDLLEGSPFLEKRRQLTPNKDGSPKTVTIAGEELTIVTGTIDELNTELQKIFPGFKGKFYDDDPIRVGEAYVDSIARDAGRMKAATDVARQVNPHAVMVEGPMAEALRRRNENLQQQQPIVDVVKAGYTPGQPVPTLPNVPEMPEEIAGVRLEDYFQSKVDKPASKAQKKILREKGNQYHEAALADVEKQMKGIKKDTQAVRKELMQRLGQARDEATAPLAELDKRVSDARKRLDILKPHAKVRQQELDTFIAGQQAEIAGLQTQADALKHKWRNALDRSKRGVEKKVHGLIRKNEELLKEAEEAAKYGPLRMQQEARRRRDMLKAPWEKARENYNKARTRAAESIARPTDERIAWARKELLEDLPENSPEWDTLIDDYKKAQQIAGGENARRYKGKPTKAAQLEIEAARQEVTRLRLQLGRAGGTVDERGMIVNPTKQSKVAARVADYDEAAQELRDVTNQLRRETDPITVDQLRTRQGQLRRRFNQGGDLNNRRRALEVTDKLAAAEQKLDEATAAEKAAMDDAYEKMQRQPEAIVTLAENEKWARRNQNVTSPSGRVREPTVGYRAGDPERIVTPVSEPPQPQAFDDVWHNPRTGRNEYKDTMTELEAIRELEKTAKTWRGNARSVALYKGRLETLRNRLDNLQAGGFDPERDLQRPLAETARRDLGVTRPVQESGAPGKVLLPSLDAIKRELDDKTTALETHIATEGAAIKAAKQETIDMQQIVQKGTADRPALLAEREVALAELQGIQNATPTGKDISRAKWAEVEDVLLDLEVVARANPALRDQNLAMTESLLQDLRKRTHQAVETDIMRKDVRKLTEDAYNGNLAKVMITATNENWQTLHKGLLEEGDVLISRQLDEQLTNLYELSKQPTLFGRTFNALTNLFKTYATLSPGFHVRNALSAIFMNTSDGVGLRYQLRGVRLWNQYASKNGGEKWLRKQSLEVQRAFEATFASGAGGRFQEAGVAQALAGQRVHERIYNKAISNMWTRAGQRSGSWVEGSVRLGMALDSMAAGDSVQTALQRITRIHFDYSQVSKADEVMKRIVPFWTYTSRNLPLQVTQMWSNPSAYLAYENFVQNFSEEPEPFTPEYMSQMGAFNLGINIPENDLPILGAASGLPILAAPDLPQVRLAEQLGDIQRTLSLEDPAALLAMGNPLLTAPIEFATGTDLYTGRHIESDEFEPAEGLLNLPVQVLAALANQRDESGRINSRFLNAFRAVNPLQDRTSRLLPQATGGDTSDASRQAESIARFLGVPVRTLTPQQQESEYRNQVRKILEEREQAQARAQYLAAS